MIRRANTIDAVKELSKYSKETLIKAFLNNNLFSVDRLIRDVKHEECLRIFREQEKISKEMDKLDIWKDYKKYKKLNDTYNRYEKQTRKLLGL